MTNSLQFLLYLLILTGLLASYSAAAERPQFNSFSVPVKVIRHTALPNFQSKLAKKYKSVIAHGATAGPNFAGHYTLIRWGCGVACQEFSIVDAVTGRIHFPRIRLNAYQAVTDGTEPFQYRLDSSLLIVAGAPDDGDKVGIFYYRWTGHDLELVMYEKRTWSR